MSRYRSLYDSYRLSNSSAIPLYEGSAAPEALQLGQHMQGMYDAAQQGAFGVNGNLDNIQNLDKDNQLALELRGRVQGKLDEFAKRGDYENMLPAVQQLAGEFSSRARELYAPKAAYLEWNKTLDDEKKGLTPDQKAGIRARTMSEYEGLRKDPTGRYVGTFKGSDIAANVDMPKWADERMKDVAIQKGGKEGYFNQDGDYLYKIGDRHEILKADTVRGILRQAAASDVTVQAHLKQMGDIAGFYARSKPLDQWSPESQQRIKEYTAAGYSLPQALEKVGSQLKQAEIMGSVENYGVNKYQQDNRWHTEDKSADPLRMQDKLKEGEPPITVNGPDGKTSLEEQDYDKVTTNLANWKGQAATLDKQISQAQQRANDPALSSDARTQWATKAQELQHQRMGVGLAMNRYGQLLTYAKEQVATSSRFGYKDYDDFLNNAATKMEASLKKVIGNQVISTLSGIQLNATSIARAIADGRATPTSVTISGGGQVPDKVITTGLDLITDDGKKVHIGSKTMGVQLGDQVYKLLQDKTNKVADFNTALKDTYKSNISNYSFHSNYWTLSDGQTESMTKALNVGGGQGIMLTLPGQFSEIPETSTFGISRKDFASYKATGVRDISPDGTVTVAVQGLDAKGNPVKGGVLEAHLDNTNAGAVLGRQWTETALASAKKGIPMQELLDAARNIYPGSSAGQLPHDVPGTVKDLGKVTVNGKETTATYKVTNPDGVTIWRTIAGPDGKPLRLKDGTELTTTNANQMAKWLDQLK
jgi:hypothetical protein